MIFVGIDLAWTYKNETGICVMNETGEILYMASACFSDEALVELISSYTDEDLVIGIDAPLVVKNEKGSRSAEGAFMRYKLNGFHLSVFAVSRSYLMRTYKVIRGEVLTNKIVERFPKVTFAESIKKGQSTVFETFPSGICAGVFSEIYPVKYKIKRKVPYEVTHKEMGRLIETIDGLEKRGLIKGFDLSVEIHEIVKKNHKHVEDMIDGFLCAYAGYLMFIRQAKTLTFGSVEEGMIMIPEIEKE